MKKNIAFYLKTVSLLNLLIGPTLLGTSLKAQPRQDEISTPQEFPPIILAIGEQRLLSIPGLKKYSVSRDSVSAALPHQFVSEANSNQLLLKAIKPGMNDLWVWKKDGSVEHRPILIEKVLTPLFDPKLLSQTQHLQQTEVILTSKAVLLRGQIRSEKELEKIVTLTKHSEGKIIDETTLAPSLKEKIQDQLNRFLKTNPEEFKNIRLEISESHCLLKGEFPNEKTKSSYLKLFSSKFAYLYFDFESLPENSNLLYVKVYLLELQKSGFQNLGLSWPDGQDQAFHFSPMGLESNLNLDIRLESLSSKGLVHVLSSPELVVKIPGDAELFSGGELPIRTSSRYYSNIQWKSFGLMLKLKALHTTSQRVRMEVSTEMSHLENALAADGVPGLSSNRLKTQIDAKYDEPLFLSGLIQQTYREQSKGLPFLKDLPILGKLFGSENYQNNQSELVAILVPQNAPPKPKMQRVLRNTPLGKIPPPRNWVSPMTEQDMRDSENFPWNALE